jgi:hypothetical protein
LEQGPTITQGFLLFADEVSAGFDVDVWPYVWKFPNPPKGLEIEIVCATKRRFSARQFAKVLRNFAAHWEEYIHDLERICV